jgi:hypothetical protein
MTTMEICLLGIFTIPPALIGYGVLWMFALDAIRMRRRKRAVAIPILTRK